MSKIHHEVRKHWLLVLVAGSFLSADLIGLDRSPLPYHDEAMYSARGCLSGYDVELGKRLYGDADALWTRPGFGPRLIGYIYQVFGFGIWQHRLSGVLAAAGIVVLTYVMALSLGVTTGWAALAAILVAGQDTFHLTSRSGRCVDMYSVLFGLAAALLVTHVVSGKSKSAEYSLLAIAGLFGAAAIGCHPLGIAVLLLPGACILSQELSFGKRAKEVASFAVFPCLALATWIFWRYHHTGTMFPPDRDGFPSIFPLQVELFKEVMRHARFHGRQPFVLSAYLIGTAGLLLGRHIDKPKRDCLLMGLIGACLFFCVGVRRAPQYLFVLAPLGGLLASVGMCELWRHRRIGLLRPGISILIALAVLNLMAAWVMRVGVAVYQWESSDPEAWSQELGKYIPSSANYVLAGGECWWALARRGISMRLYSRDLSERERTLEWYDYIVANEEDMKNGLFLRYIQPCSGNSSLDRHFIRIGQVVLPQRPVHFGGVRRKYTVWVYARTMEAEQPRIE